MADRRSLEILGFVFGGVTAAVMLVAVMVVKNHIDGRLTLDAGPAPIVVAAAPTTTTVLPRPALTLTLRQGLPSATCHRSKTAGCASASR